MCIKINHETKTELHAMKTNLKQNCSMFTCDKAISNTKPKTKTSLGLVAQWSAQLEFELGDPGSIPGRATIPLGSNLGQVVYTHCLPSFSAPRNWGTKGSFRRLSGYGD